MGVTNIKARVSNIKNPNKKVSLDLLVDTGAAYTVLPKNIVEKLNLKPQRVQDFSLADGTVVKRNLGYAMMSINGQDVPSTVVLGEKDDTGLLGVVTLENMGLMVDPFNRKLIPMRLMM